MRDEAVSGGYLQIDETPIRYFAPGHGKTQPGYFWAAHWPGGDVIFHGQTSRAAKCLEKIVPVNFRGTIQCDGYTALDAFARQREAIELVSRVRQLTGWMERVFRRVKRHFS